MRATLCVMIAMLVGALASVNRVGAREPGAMMTGADLLSACSKPDPDWIGFCHGYVQAVHDGVFRPDEDICPPSDLTRAQITRADVASPAVGERAGAVLPFVAAGRGHPFARRHSTAISNDEQVRP